MLCPKCESRQMVEIGVAVAGERLIMKSCSACDLRWWEGYQGRVPLSDLLDMASKER